MKLMLFTSWLLLLLPVSVSAQVDHTHSPATVEDCRELSPELQAIVAAMDGESLRIEALPKPESTPVVEPGIHKLEVALRPLSEVELMRKENPTRNVRQREDAMTGNAKQGENVKGLFGGFIRLTIPKDGLYRISADSPIWIEVIDGEKPIERVTIAPRLRCGRIHKSLGFPLQREKSYWLELSGSVRPDVAVLITEESDR